MPGNGVSTETLPSAHTKPMFYVLIYASITLAGTFLSAINTVVQYVGAYYASRFGMFMILRRWKTNVFHIMVQTIIHIPTRYCDAGAYEMVG
jgi:hypothetical protein